MIYEQEKEIELITNYSCNWNCDFCAVDTHNHKEITFEVLEEKLNIIDRNFKGWNVTISGGEPGMMSRDRIQYIIDRLKESNCSISLNTNGLFLKKYPDLAKYFDYVLYHCSENLDTDPDYESASKFQAKIDFMIVVSDNNIHNLDKFMKRNMDTTFHIVAATKADGGLPVTLSNKNRYSILGKKYPNISKESLKRLIVKEKDFGSIIYI